MLTFSNKVFSFLKNPNIYSYISITVVLIIYSDLRLSMIPYGWEVDVDVFYHVRMADFFPDVCISKVFPWTQLSIWKDHFYDKELGFHAVLYIIRKIPLFINISEGAPFNYINIIFTGIFLLIYTKLIPFNNLLIKSSIPILLLITSPLFLLRINMIRPHVLSMILFALTICILLSDFSLKRKLIYIFMMSWIYALSYSSPQLIFIPIFSYCCAVFIISRNKKYLACLWLLPTSLAGILIAFLIHPQFPNTYYLVIKNILGTSKAQVVPGTELFAPSLKVTAQNAAVFFLIIAGAVFAVYKKSYNIRMFTLFVISCICALGFLFSQRFIEYAVPSSVIFFVYTLDLIAGNFFLNLKVNKIMKASILTTVAFLCFFLLKYEFTILSSSSYFPCYSFANWSQKNIAPGTYIGHIRWSDFPRLFYPAPQYLYSMALDPMFSYFVYPEKTESLENFNQIKVPVSPERLKEILGTNLVFISNLDPGCANYLIEKEAKVLYKGYDGWLLKL